jgi:hypothetical protein
MVHYIRMKSFTDDISDSNGEYSGYENSLNLASALEKRGGENSQTLA